MTTPLGTNNRRITNQRIMNPRIRHQIRLELIQINIQRTIKPQRARNTADNLRDETIQVLERRTLDVEIAATDVVDGFVVDEERTVGVFDCGMRGEDGVVGFYDCGGDAGGRVDGEFEFAFFAVVGGEAFEEEGAEA